MSRRHGASPQTGSRQPSSCISHKGGHRATFIAFQFHAGQGEDATVLTITRFEEHLAGACWLIFLNISFSSSINVPNDDRREETTKKEKRRGRVA